MIPPVVWTELVVFADLFDVPADAALLAAAVKPEPVHAVLERAADPITIPPER